MTAPSILQGDLLTWPDELSPVERRRVFTGGRDSSVEAARRVLPRSGSQRAAVLAAIVARPRTDEELAMALGLAGNSVRPRRRELEAAGLVVASEVRRPTMSGCPAIVWEATPAGLDALLKVAA